MLRTLLARRRTIESITAPITRIVDRLQEHAEHHSDKAFDHACKAAQHTGLADVSKVEVDRAKEQAEKFASLVR